MIKKIKEEFKNLSNAEQAKHLQKYFKTGERWQKSIVIYL